MNMIVMETAQATTWIETADMYWEFRNGQIFLRGGVIITCKLVVD